MRGNVRSCAMLDFGMISHLILMYKIALEFAGVWERGRRNGEREPVMGETSILELDLGRSI